MEKHLAGNKTWNNSSGSSWTHLKISNRSAKRVVRQWPLLIQKLPSLSIARGSKEPVIETLLQFLRKKAINQIQQKCTACCTSKKEARLIIPFSNCHPMIGISCEDGLNKEQGDSDTFQWQGEKLTRHISLIAAKRYKTKDDNKVLNDWTETRSGRSPTPKDSSCTQPYFMNIIKEDEKMRTQTQELVIRSLKYANKFAWKEEREKP